MINSIVLRIIVAIVLAVFLVGSWLTTGSPNASLLSFFSLAVMVLTLAFFVWDKWIWKWSLVQKIPRIHRNIHGTWEARLESLWVDPNTGTKPDPQTVYFVIRQTSSKVSVLLMSKESKSISVVAQMAINNEEWNLRFIYCNTSQLDRRKESPIHYGTGILELLSGDGSIIRLNGVYWTDRDSKGKLELLRRNKKIVGSYDDAEKLFGSA
ncbi:hypothetical protein ACR9WD_03385 [Glutamicibacter sp. PAEs-4]|uniref:Cap15 family cyclic dinucleotide receptor domain-containing protein n=1 Tax=Glutamicibacter sp. PAEs-4 TaxID=3444114 RepID=UPI003EBB1554